MSDDTTPAEILDPFSATRSLPSPTPFVIVMMSVGEASRARQHAGPEATVDGEIDDILFEMFDEAIAEGPFYDHCGRPFGMPANLPAPTYIPNRWGKDEEATERLPPDSDYLGRMGEMLKWLDSMGGHLALHPLVPPFPYLKSLAQIGLVDRAEGENQRVVFSLNDRSRAQLAFQVAGSTGEADEQ